MKFFVNNDQLSLLLHFFHVSNAMLQNVILVLLHGKWLIKSHNFFQDDYSQQLYDDDGNLVETSLTNDEKKELTEFMVKVRFGVIGLFFMYICQK